jgi:hypothetical protein
MEYNGYTRTLYLLILATFIVIFLSMKSVAGPVAQPTTEQLNAFKKLYAGHSAWPVYQVSDGKISVDGKMAEPEWQSAQKIYITGEWMWNSLYNDYMAGQIYSGLSDFIAVWRVLYDNECMYISCEFLDDVHSPGDGREPWIYNDGVDFVLSSLNNLMFPNFDARILRIWRRFTEKEGLIGMANQTRFPCPLTQCGWVETEPEGSPNLGGVGISASAVDSIGCAYPGAWVMEIKVPLAGNFLPAGSGLNGAALPGASFKMNLTVHDDDEPGIQGYNDKYFLQVGMQRYPVWWPDLTLPDTLKFSPTFMFAGYRNSVPPENMVDEYNLYCGKNGADYAAEIDEYTVCRLSSVNGALSVPGNGFSVCVQPNPLGALGAVLFNVPAESDVGLQVFDVCGVLVKDFGSATCAAGRHRMDWNTHDVIPGNYFVRLRAGTRTVLKKITVLR